MEPWKDWQTGQPKRLGDLWTLERNGRRAVCVLQGHPIGCEARLEVDGDFKRSEAFREGADAVVTADGWRRLFEGNGWTCAP